MDEAKVFLDQEPDLCFFSLTFADHLLFQVTRHFLVVTEIFLMPSASPRDRTEDCGITVKFPLWNLGLDDLVLPAGVHSLDLSTASGNIPHHIAHVVFRDFYLQIVNWFQKTGITFQNSLFKCLFACYLESHIFGIDGMLFSIIKIDFNIHHSIACKHPFL